MPCFKVYETVTLIRYVEAETEQQAKEIVLTKSATEFDEVDCSPSASGIDQIRVELDSE